MGGDAMARPDWIPKKVWKVIKHAKRPKFIPKDVWKMLKDGMKTEATQMAVKLIAKIFA